MFIATFCTQESDRHFFESHFVLMASSSTFFKYCGYLDIVESTRSYLKYEYSSKLWVLIKSTNTYRKYEYLPKVQVLIKSTSTYHLKLKNDTIIRLFLKWGVHQVPKYTSVKFAVILILRWLNAPWYICFGTRLTTHCKRDFV